MSPTRTGRSGMMSTRTMGQEVVLWRGMKDVRVEGTAFMATGGVEMAAMSTTASPEVALRYSSNPPMMFKYVVGSLSKAVSISFLSVYPKEQEHLYPPGTYLRPRKKF